ncbi:MAG: hypothetical protein EXS47_01295 [Candidatus Zambryskibacteria bacterium]|nr:hypothetical protein [Candidatus Zambryskibacteria bacterium]
MKYSFTNIKKSSGVPLGVVLREGEVCMFVRSDKKTTSVVELLFSANGVDFIIDKRKVKIENLSGKMENIKLCDKFSISQTPNGYVMTYVRHGKTKNKNVLVVARAKDVFEWKVKAEQEVDDSHHTTSVYNKTHDNFELYRDGLFIKHQSSRTLSFWKEKPGLVFTSRNHHFDSGHLRIIGSAMTEQGIVLFYDASVEHRSKTLLQVGVLILDINNPKKVIWRSSFPVYQAVAEVKTKVLPISPLGLVHLNNKFIIYWVTADKNLIVATVPALFKEIEHEKYHPKILDRYHKNPIIEPRGLHHWEKEGTFNPAVIEDDEGTIHLLYRAVGGDGISRVGYARSKDGMYFTKRSNYPVFEPSMGYGLPDPAKTSGPIGYHPAIYTSGGGWGGSEDPRATRIGETVYMMYVAFEGWNSVRIALTSISLEDFKNGKWSWKKPVLLSAPGTINKNWLLFPEKINGKYAIVHSITPEVLIEYIDDIDNIKKFIHSLRGGGPQPGRKNSWDGLLRGAGPPPLRTELGWLLLYHALDKKDTSKYKLGAMILDINDPSKILYRSKHAILSPDMHYENNGKPGVIYASGAIIREDDLYIYYGGADRVVCVATTPLKKFLNYLVTGRSKSLKLNKV